MMVDQIPLETKMNQTLATNPYGNAWVSANAGSGKTYVLTRRVLRLLLAGARPDKILCLTFTKTAAAEMSRRVFDELSSWCVMEDEVLKDVLLDLGREEGHYEINEAMLDQARLLFAQALETPGGLKIQTIHAFCKRLLHQFSFEAGLPPQFDLIEDTFEKVIIEQARNEVLQQAQDRNTDIGREFLKLLERVEESKILNAIDEGVKKKQLLQNWFTIQDNKNLTHDNKNLTRDNKNLSYDNKNLSSALSEALGLTAYPSLADVQNEILNSPHFPLSEWTAAIPLLRTGSKTIQDIGTNLSQALGANSKIDMLYFYMNIFCKNGVPPYYHGDLRSQKFVTGTFQKQQPELAKKLLAEHERISHLLEIWRRAVCRENTMALMSLLQEIFKRYDRHKFLRKALDNNDLITKTAELLATPEARHWVHYKLDQGIEHILVDEAQDTSPAQWEIINALSEEFFAGSGQVMQRRTIFAVGDEKQSIYSFQGAKPAIFDQMRQNIETKSLPINMPFSHIPFHLSFRSTPDIMQAVDAVFNDPEHYQGLTAQNEYTIHETIRQKEPGLVEIWPIIERPEQVILEDWTSPIDDKGLHDEKLILAQNIAAKIRSWLDQGEMIFEKDLGLRKIEPKDILILVQGRNDFLNHMIRMLAEHEIPVAGLDRFNMLRHIATKDLLALAQVMLLPEDDLTLAGVLKSPFFGLTDDDLFAIGHGREGHLWQSLQQASEDNQRYQHVWALLTQWRARVDHVRPYDFYTEILEVHQGRQLFIQRLGHEAEEVLNEFLQACRDFEQEEVSSLQGFIRWFELYAGELKREIDQSRNEVRLMTVHGAKGLESHIVFLADTSRYPDPRKTDKITQLEKDTSVAWIWNTTSNMDSTIERDLAEREKRLKDEEYRRLLYVAMTRAEDRLYICGTKGRKDINERCWYKMIEHSLKPLTDEVYDPDLDLNVYRYEKTHRENLPVQDEQLSQSALQTIPAWARSPVEYVEPRIDELMPSTASTKFEDEGSIEITEKDGANVNYTAVLSGHTKGVLAHKLLEFLPNIAPQQRPQIALKWLERKKTCLGLDDFNFQPFVHEICQLIVDPAFCQLFGSNARAEVPILGMLEKDKKPYRVAGTIDRLVDLEDRLLIVDFKTSPQVPEQVEDTPPAYILQLALYRLLLQNQFKSKPIEAGLLWTDQSILHWLPDHSLSTACAQYRNFDWNSHAAS